VPAVATTAAIVLGFEQGSKMKYTAIVLFTIAIVTRFSYDDIMDYYNGRQFFGKYFLFVGLMLMTMAFLIQKKIIGKNPGASMTVLVLYVYGSGTIMSFIIYMIKFYNDLYNEDSMHNTNEDFKGIFFSWAYIQQLASVSMIFITLVLVEAYKTITLMYINKMGYISQVTLYGGLDGFFVIVIYLIFKEVHGFDYIFIVILITAYVALYLSKYSQRQVIKKQKKMRRKVKFVRKIEYLEDASQLLDVTKIKIDGTYFYESDERRTSLKGILYGLDKSKETVDDLSKTTPVEQKQIFLNKWFEKEKRVDLDQTDIGAQRRMFLGSSGKHQTTNFNKNILMKTSDQDRRTVNKKQNYAISHTSETDSQT